MVVLATKNIYPVSDLEWELIVAHIEYTIDDNGNDYGIDDPYLIVDGVPLDYERSLKWIGEQCK